MALEFVLNEHRERVSRNNGNIKDALAELKAAGRRGVGYPGDRVPHTLGLTRIKPLRIDVVAKYRDGAKQTTTRYLCGRASYTTLRECQKHCGKSGGGKSKTSTPMSSNVTDPIGRLKRALDTLPAFVGKSGECVKHVTVKIKYVVERNYEVQVDVYWLVWLVLINFMPSAYRIVTSWNKRVRDHEQRHVDDVRRACERVLPDKVTHTVTGEGESEEEAEAEAEKELLGLVAKGNLDIMTKFNAAVRDRADDFHTTERTLPYPNLG